MKLYGVIITEDTLCVIIFSINEEYTAKYGLYPCAASPAAKVTACSSAIPTSKNLSGNFFSNLLSFLSYMLII